MNVTVRETARTSTYWVTRWFSARCMVRATSGAGCVSGPWREESWLESMVKEKKPGGASRRASSAPARVPNTFELSIAMACGAQYY